MNSLDFLNSITTGVKAAEAPDFKPHPLGEFHGVVLSVEQKYIKQASNSVVELKIATTDQSGAKVGVANYNEWMFTDADQIAAQTNQDDREKLLNRISRMKRLFVDLEALPHDIVDAMPWSSGGNMHDPGVLEAFDLLKGKKCSVTVKANTKPNKPAMIFVNAPVATVTGVTGAAPQVQRQQAPQAPMGQPPMGQPPMGHPQHPQYNAPGPQIPFGAPPTQNLNNVRY